MQEEIIEDPQEIRNEISEFLDEYEAEIIKPSLHSDKHLIINFSDLIKFSPKIGDFVIDNPKDAINVFVDEIKNKVEELPLDFTVRFKNAKKYTSLLINQVRPEHINKFITVEGLIKQKSDVRGQAITARFECPSCGKIISIDQLDESQFREPSGCSCGRKGKFLLLSKQTIPIFSLSLEEPTELISGGTKLSRIKIICKGGLTNENIERFLYQGVRVEVSGILQEIPVKNNKGGLTTKVDWYLDANYVKIYDDSFMNLKWTAEDVKEFEKLAKQEDWLSILRQSIFYDVHGYEEECEGVILQLFGGVEQKRDGAKIRGHFGILLVGDPGSAKSTILKIAQQFSPKAIYVAGSGVSGVGVTASVVKDELLGGFTLEAGAIVLCNNGCLMLDELDKIRDEHKEALHEPLSEGTVSVSKANISGTMPAQTSVLAAANPKFGSYSEYDTVYSQISLTPTLINRFDLVYPIKDSAIKDDDDLKIAMKILSRGGLDEPCSAKYPREFIKKYIGYAKKINPVIPVEVQRFLASSYAKLKQKRRKASVEGRKAVPVTGRNVEAFRRLAEAVARSRLHDVVTLEDAEIGYKKVLYSVEQMGIDPDSGDAVDEQMIGAGMARKDLAARIHTLIREMGSKNESVSFEELYNVLEHDGFKDMMKVNEIVEKLKRSGDVFEPKPGQLKAAY